MKGRSDTLRDVIRDAGTSGTFAEPIALLAALKVVDQPLAALSDHDQANSLFAALFDEFGFLQRPASPPHALQPSERARWTELVRWAFCALRDWSPASDPANRTIAAIFVVAQAGDADGLFWSLVPNELLTNGELIERLASIVRSFGFGFGTRGNQAAPIWESEAVEKFKTADHEGDWVMIGTSLPLFDRQFFFSVPLTQSVRCLYACGVTHLSDALSALAQSLAAKEVARALSTTQSLTLAGHSDNPYLQFGCAYQTFRAFGRGERLSKDELQITTDLFVKVAADGPRWAQWMQVFNGYPMRFPALQTPLGRALAEVPASAVEAYIKAIVLSAIPAGQVSSRGNVAECLRAFRASAPAARRSLLWHLAFERWSEWNFGQKNPDAHLLGISWSELDYPSMMFAFECLDEAGRRIATEQIIAELRTIDNQWFASSTDIVTAWNRLLSRYQAYACAWQVLSTGEEWPCENKTCLPFDLGTNGYAVLKYRMTSQ